MGYADLGDAVAGPTRLDQQFGAEGMAGAVELHIVQECAREQLESTIHIAGRVAEHDVDEQVPAPAVEAPDPRIGARPAVADYDVCRGQQRQESFELTD